MHLILEVMDKEPSLRVIWSGAAALGVIGLGTIFHLVYSTHLELVGDEGQYLARYRLARAQQPAGKAQGAELYGEAQPVVWPSAPRDEGQVGRAESVVPDKVGLGRGQRKQRLDLDIGEGAAAGHDGVSQLE